MSHADARTQEWTIARLLAWTRDYLERSGVESPRLCAEILLGHALGCERIHLYTRHEHAPPPDALARFRESVRHAAQGTPIAYITGEKDFYSLRFEVGPAVLIPRPETELLVERTIDVVRRAERPQARILDIGTGSGCIAVALARHLPEARLGASDLSPAALEVARRNAARHGVAGRIELRPGDLLAPWAGDAAWLPADVLVSNPPYVALRDAPGLPRNVRDFEPAEALFAGEDGLDVIRRLVEAAPAALASGGHLLLEVAYDQARDVCGLLARGPWEAVRTHRDLGGHERIVQARRGAG